MKRFLLLITAIYATIFISGCSYDESSNDFIEQAKNNAIVSALDSTYKSGIMTMNNYLYTVNFRFSPENLITADNKTYSQDFSKFAITMATDAYSAAKFTMNNSSSNPASASDNTSIYAAFGMQDAEEIILKSDDYSVDKNDIETFIISHKKVTVEGTDYEILIGVMTGTNGSYEQWASNFDIGADTTLYATLTGSHPEWTNKNYHKGFYVAATRVNNKIQEYITSKVDSSAKKIFFLTGHSRGAAIANILGAMYEKSPSVYKSFTYTFAAPNTTTDNADAATYKTVFNIVNKDDFVTIIPVTKWGFTRNGITKAVSIEEDSTYAAEWYFMFSYDRNNIVGFYVSAGANSTDAQNAFNAIALNRNQLYEISSKEEDKFSASYGNAQAAMDKFTSLGLTKFANLSVSSDNKTIEGYISPYFIMEGLVNIITNKESESNILTGLSSDKYVNFAGKFVTAAVYGGMEKSHLPPSYYLLAYEL